MQSRLYLAAIAGLLVSVACGPQTERATTEEGQAPSQQGEPMAKEQGQTTTAPRAVAMLEPKSGSDLQGEATFAEEPNGQVMFQVEISNVQPGEHAVHIHETGDCSAPDASSAGGHWNPTGEEHGKWGEHPFHLGDIGNIDVGQDGKGSLELKTDLWSLDPSGEHSFLGKAIVVHAGADDFKTQPAGGAGARIGCGVIKLEGEAKTPTT